MAMNDRSSNCSGVAFGTLTRHSRSAAASIAMTAPRSTSANASPFGCPLTMLSSIATWRAAVSADNCASTLSCPAAGGAPQANAAAMAAAIALARGRNVDRDALIVIIVADQLERERSLCRLGQIDHERRLRQHDDARDGIE